MKNQFLALALLLNAEAFAHRNHTHAPVVTPITTEQVLGFQARAINDTIDLRQVGTLLTETVIALRDSTNAQQRGRMMMPLDDHNLNRWSWVPVINGGLRYGDMTEIQKNMASTILRSAMSAMGYTIAQDIRNIDDADHKQTRILRGRWFLDKGQNEYTIKIYGTPGSDRWILRFHGHHLVLTLAMVNGVPTSVSPTVFGVLLSLADGARSISNIRTRAHAVAQTLTPAQRVTGISTRPLDDLMMGRDRNLQAGNLTRLLPLGVPGSQLSTEQKAAVMGVVEEYLSYYKPAIAFQEVQQIHAAGINNIDFLWAGDIAAHTYIRIQGPTFILEYNTFSGEVNHIHSVYRNLTNDNGYDALKQHLLEGHTDAQGRMGTEHRQ